MEEEIPFNNSPLLKIKGQYTAPHGHGRNTNTYILSVEEALRSVIDENAIPLKCDGDPAIHFKKLLNELPKVIHSPIDATSSTISAILICNANFTHGVGGFMADYYIRWGIPGKQLPVVNVRSLCFEFAAYPKKKFFFNEVVIEITESRDIALLKNNLPKLAEDLRLNILAVSHARQIVSVKPLTLEQKKILIQENVSSLLERANKEFDNNIFEQMQDLLLKATAEHKATQIKEQLVPLLEMRPGALDRDTYLEMQHFVLQLKDSYTSTRELRHIMRVISSHYIFRKVITNAISTNPQKRHISLKLLRTSLHMPSHTLPVLGILVGINMVRENELFEERHLLQAVQTCVSDVIFVEGSGMIDQRQNDRVRTLYIEVKHPSGEPFSHSEVRELRKKLPKELKSQIESVIHPIFVHRNEEEIMRNILELSKQLKYISDLPQVIINFHKQTSFEISFTVVLLRLLKANDLPLKNYFDRVKTHLKIIDCDSKVVGVLRKKVPKEANVFEVRLNKKSFLRKDYSLDIYKARLSIFSELTRLLGEIRDYNGGMISKQYEVLSELKQALLASNVKNDFVLENFFYSITPNYMQSLMDPVLLKKHFLLLIDLLERDYGKEPIYTLTEKVGDHYLVMIGATSSSLKEFIFKSIESFTPTQELTHSFVIAYDISCIGFVLRCHEEEEQKQFINFVAHGIDQWRETIQCNITSLSPMLSG
jgi:hypothetical protein